MSDNIILRPVFNRPEMLYLSIEYEMKARELFGKTNSITTVFLVEHDSPPQTMELIKQYPYKKRIIQREKKYGLTPNILEGMKEVFTDADDFIIYIEDDVLVHESYFKYLKEVLSMGSVGKFSIVSPYNFNDAGEVNIIRGAHHYAALAPLITKEFFEKYIKPCIGQHYYKSFQSRSKFVCQLNSKYKDHWKSKRYKYVDGTHNEQAGLINRLVDAAMIDEDMFVIMPMVNRQIHIGFYGKNRPGTGIPGNNFDERLENMRDIITNNKFFEMTKAKSYDDYLVFSDKLDSWDGKLIMEGR